MEKFPSLIRNKILYYLRIIPLLHQTDHHQVIFELQVSLEDHLEINRSLGLPHISCGRMYLNFRKLDQPERYFSKPPLDYYNLHRQFCGYTSYTCGDKTIVGSDSTRLYDPTTEPKPNLPLLPDHYFYSKPEFNPQFCFG